MVEFVLTNWESWSCSSTLDCKPFSKRWAGWGLLIDWHLKNLTDSQRNNVEQRIYHGATNKRLASAINTLTDMIHARYKGVK